MVCTECSASHLCLDYLCEKCRTFHDGTDHPWVGKTIASVTAHNDMRGVVLRFADGSAFHAIYSRFDDAL